MLVILDVYMKGSSNDLYSTVVADCWSFELDVDHKFILIEARTVLWH